MLIYIIKRILYMLLTLFLVSIIIFSIIHIIPGDPIRLVYGVIHGTQEMIDAKREILHLNDPIIVQYYYWFKDIIRGNFGESLRSGEKVFPLIITRFSRTIILSFVSMAIAIFLALILGVLAAYKRNTFYDFFIMGFSVLGISIPVFWSGLLAILFFSIYLGVLPSIGYVSFLVDPLDSIKHLILPAGILGFSITGYTTRITRSQMIDVLNQDYVRTARAKGVAERAVVYKHALKNALIPIVTVIGIQFGFLMGGQVLVEVIFGWPGIGTLIVKAILNRDYTIVQGVSLIIAVFLILISLVVDIIYAFLNPKIRYQ